MPWPYDPYGGINPATYGYDPATQTQAQPGMPAPLPTAASSELDKLQFLAAIHQSSGEGGGTGDNFQAWAAKLGVDPATAAAQSNEWVRQNSNPSSTSLWAKFLKSAAGVAALAAAGVAAAGGFGAAAGGAAPAASVAGAAPLAPGAGVLAGAGLPTVGSIPLLGGGAAAAGALAPGAGVLLPGVASAGGMAAGAGVLAPASSYLPNAIETGLASQAASVLPAGGGVSLPAGVGASTLAGGAGSASVPGAAPLPPGGGVLSPHAEPVVQGGLGLPGWLTIGGAVAGALGTNDDPQTSTTQSGPPEYLRPYLEQAAGQAANLYNANPSAPVIPFSPQTQEALRLTEQRARAGSPVGNAAQQYGTNVLSGNYLNSNPYLDATFERAARGVTNAVQSNFGRSGRDAGGPDAAGVAAMHYGDLANQIYGGNYQAERDRQQQLVPYAGQLAAQDYADYGQLAGVGSQYEALQREQADAQGTALDQYLARLQGLPGASVTQTTPTNRNWLAGAAGGALLGSQLGQPWGSLYSGQYGG